MMFCEHCHQLPHHPRCPLAPEPPVFDYCEACGEKIYDGDEYYEINNHNYCEACVSGGTKLRR